jgi:hypothetical protein
MVAEAEEICCRELDCAAAVGGEDDADNKGLSFFDGKTVGAKSSARTRFEMADLPAWSFSVALESVAAAAALLTVEELLTAPLPLVVEFGLPCRVAMLGKLKKELPNRDRK